MIFLLNWLITREALHRPQIFEETFFNKWEFVCFQIEVRVPRDGLLKCVSIWNLSNEINFMSSSLAFVSSWAEEIDTFLQQKQTSWEYRRAIWCLLMQKHNPKTNSPKERKNATSAFSEDFIVMSLIIKLREDARKFNCLLYNYFWFRNLRFGFEACQEGFFSLFK